MELSEPKRACNYIAGVIPHLLQWVGKLREPSPMTSDAHDVARHNTLIGLALKAAAPSVKKGI